MLILYFSQESQDHSIHVDFESFKLALWPTLRQKFMNFWSFLTRPGNKHDEKISSLFNSQAGSSSRFCLMIPHESHNFLLLLNHNWFSSCNRQESQAARDFATILQDTCPYGLQMQRNELKYGFNCQNHACFPGMYLSILHKQSSTGFKQDRLAEFHGQKC